MVMQTADMRHNEQVAMLFALDMRCIIILGYLFGKICAAVQHAVMHAIPVGSDASVARSP